MADVKISQLTQSTSAAGSSELAISEGGVSYRISKDNFLSGVENPVIEVKTVLSSAQLKTLNTTPITLISAPGGANFINIINYTYIYRYGTEAFFYDGLTPAIKIDSEQIVSTNLESASTTLYSNSGTISNASDSIIDAPVIIESGQDSLTGDGRLILIPWNKSEFGYFDTANEVAGIVDGSLLNDSGVEKFAGAVHVPENNYVVVLPWDSTKVIRLGDWLSDAIGVDKAPPTNLAADLATRSYIFLGVSPLSL